MVTALQARLPVFCSWRPLPLQLSSAAGDQAEDRLLRSAASGAAGGVWELWGHGPLKDRHHQPLVFLSK